MESYKILVVYFSADLTFQLNTKEICKKGFTKLYMLRRLKNLGASTNIIHDVYLKQVRCVLEYASPVWSSMLSQRESHHIERVQKAALSIIYGPQSYKKLLEKSNLVTLSDRRCKLSERFTQKALKSDQFSSWFVPRKTNITTRQNNMRYEVPARTNRF